MPERLSRTNPRARWHIEHKLDSTDPADSQMWMCIPLEDAEKDIEQWLSQGRENDEAAA